jgi:hypothetical protein
MGFLYMPFASSACSSAKSIVTTLLAANGTPVHGVRTEPPLKQAPRLALAQ